MNVTQKIAKSLSPRIKILVSAVHQGTRARLVRMVNDEESSEVSGVVCLKCCSTSKAWNTLVTRMWRMFTDAFPELDGERELLFTITSRVLKRKSHRCTKCKRQIIEFTVYFGYNPATASYTP